jgi:hypothetical protein
MLSNYLKMSVVEQSACEAKEFEIFQKQELENFLKKQQEEQKQYKYYLKEYSVDETNQRNSQSNTGLTPFNKRQSFLIKIK